MTIDELIEFCETGANHYNHTGPTAEKFAAIAAALRAGQEMRSAGGYGGFGHEFAKVRTKEWLAGAKAWDAATKGDKP